MEDYQEKAEAKKYKELAELLMEHSSRLRRIAKECESVEEILDLIETLDDIGKLYLRNKKSRELAHFNLI